MRWLSVGLVLALVASLGVFGASSASSQTGPVAQVWTRKLSSGNVEFGLSVTSAGSRTMISPTNRYLLYSDFSTRVGEWYYSDWRVIGDDPYRTYARVQARKLVSGNVEFGLQIGGLGFEADSKSRVWLPRERYLTYQATSANSVVYSSDFNVRAQAHECLNGTVFSSPDISRIGLANDCAVLLEARDILQGTSDALSNWNASTPMASWTGITVNPTPDRVTSLAYVWSPRINGRIPPHLGALSAVENLTFSQQSLTGSIPAELGNLTNLAGLILSRNSLTGSIPAELGNLTELTWLQLNRNSLTGSIPAELGNLTKLRYFYLHDNQLTGSIPTQLGNIQGNRNEGDADFIAFWLSNNNLTGGIPTELGKLTKLSQLVLNNNNLSGSIPASIGQMTNLTQAILGGNNLSGSIPSQLGNLRSLTDLYLYDIEGLTGTPRADDNPGLSGCIPRALNGTNRAGETIEVKRGNLEFCPTS